MAKPGEAKSTVQTLVESYVLLANEIGTTKFEGTKITLEPQIDTKVSELSVYLRSKGGVGEIVRGVGTSRYLVHDMYGIPGVVQIDQTTDSVA